MSRIGKLPIKLPSGVSAEIKDGKVSVTGPKGTLSVQVKAPATVALEDGELKISRPDDERRSKAFQGLYRALINNAVTGVSQGFERRLEVVGVGYKAEVTGQVLRLSLGFAGPKDFLIPEGLAVTVEKDNIILKSADRRLLGNSAASIRSYRPPEPYKGKGIRYQGEKIRRKAGKAAAGGKK